MSETPDVVDIGPAVERLEGLLLPRLVAFGEALTASNNRLVVETCSIRHTSAVHVIGVTCRPKGTDHVDPTTVALIISVIGLTRLTFHAQVIWQAQTPTEWASPSTSEAFTSEYRKLTGRQLAQFEREVQGLLPVLAGAVRRGKPSYE